jgi:hypothetical protein
MDVFLFCLILATLSKWYFKLSLMREVKILNQKLVAEGKFPMSDDEYMEHLPQSAYVYAMLSGASLGFQIVFLVLWIIKMILQA